MATTTILPIRNWDRDSFLRKAIMKSISNASSALLVAERELTAGVDRIKDHAKFRTGAFYGTMSRTIKDIAIMSQIDLEPDEPCYQCGNVIDDPYLYVKEFCSQDHLDKFTAEIEDNENAMQSILLGDEDAIRENALMRIALHKLLNMNLTGEASFTVADVLQSISKDYGVV